MARNISQNDLLANLENEVSEVTALLRENVEKILERGEKIDNLQSRSDDLQFSSSDFRLSSGKMRKKMWWKNFKMSCILGLIVLIIFTVTVIVLLVETYPWSSPENAQSHNGTGEVLNRIRRKTSGVMAITYVNAVAVFFLS